MDQLMPLLPIISLLHKNPEWFTFPVLTYPGCPGNKAIKRTIMILKWHTGGLASSGYDGV